MNACTGNCTQGRHCTCRRPVMAFGGCACSLGQAQCNCAPSAPPQHRPPQVLPTRPTLLARLRRWWRLGKLRAELAGVEADHAAVWREVANLQAAGFGPDEEAAAALARATISMRKLELLDLSQRRVNLLGRIKAAEGQA